MHDLAQPQRFMRFGAMMECFDHLFGARTVDELFKKVPLERAAKNLIDRGSNESDAELYAGLGWVALDVEHEEMGKQVRTYQRRINRGRVLLGQQIVGDLAQLGMHR